VKVDGRHLETTRDGRIRVICSADTPHVARLLGRPVRAGDRARLEVRKHWHMADEVAYVIPGKANRCSGKSRQRSQSGTYYARIATEPTTWEFKADDTVFVPQNHVPPVRQHGR